MEGHAIRLIAIDLDDTLLRADLGISPANREAVSAAAAAGVKVVLASGRNIHSMGAYAEELGIGGAAGFLICTNGAEIVRGGETIFRNPIAYAECREAVDVVEERGLSWQVYEGGSIHVSRANEWTDLDSKLTGQPNLVIDDPEPFFRRGQLKFVCPGEPKAVSAAAQALSERFRGRLSILVSKPYFLEILDIGSDKGLALERVAALLGFARGEVMAIGDALNDLGMVRWAGLGCAVGNAVPAVKEAATLVADRGSEEDAVAWLIRRALPGLTGLQGPGRP
jgi:Cof subfamily protein (haloacid dehalogenase superfamily)